MASSSGHTSPILGDAEQPPGSHHHGVGGDGHGSGSPGDQSSLQEQNLQSSQGTQALGSMLVRLEAVVTATATSQSQQLSKLSGAVEQLAGRMAPIESLLYGHLVSQSQQASPRASPHSGDASSVAAGVAPSTPPPLPAFPILPPAGVSQPPELVPEPQELSVQQQLAEAQRAAIRLAAEGAALSAFASGTSQA